MDHYFTIDKEGMAEFKDRGSRFIAFALPIIAADDFKKKLQALKKEHPKAVHHCFAYRIGTDQHNFRVSDDGEPSGSAGRPILGQIDSRQLTNTAIIVVRYFGGTLLGIPGLINAYKTVSALVLQTIPIVQRYIEIDYQLNFTYDDVNEVMRIVKQYNCSIIEKELQLFPYMKIGIPANRLEEVLSRIKDVRNVECKRIVYDV